MLRSLFLKIFLWFWLAMAIIYVSAFTVMELNRQEPFSPPSHNAADMMFAAYAQTASEIYERDGVSPLASYMNRMEDSAHIKGVLFDSNGRELSGRLVPNKARELAQRAAQTKRLEREIAEGAGSEGPTPLLAQFVNLEGGRAFVLVAEMPPDRGGHPPNWRVHAVHMSVVLLIGGLFCYWLARYLTAPVAKLRAATRELADGNLNARVAPLLGKRRDELVSLGLDFDVMAERIESLLGAQRRLLGDISHELRSPLARLNVALELARGRAGVEATSALDRINRESENLNQMIGQLLTLTRLESDGVELQKSEIDLPALVRRVVEDADFEARSHDRAVRVTASDDCTIIGVEHLLRSAIENVVRNAIRYTDTKTLVEVNLDCEQTNGKRFAVVSVRDHGQGVPENALDKIFSSFYRVEDARDRQTGGAGLGLAITARAVRLHGGTVSATNAPDGGLIIKMNLPTHNAKASVTSAS